MSKLTIIANANLIKTSQNEFRLAVRWILGEKPDDITASEAPKTDDKFVLTVRTHDKLYLKADGTLGAKGRKAKHTIEPMRYAMVDPPRVLEAVPGDPAGSRRVAIAPTAQVDPMDIQDSGGQSEKDRRLAPGKGLGVLHLLDRLDPEENQKAAAAVFANAAKAFLGSDGRALADPSDEKAADTLAESVADALAAYFAQSRGRVEEHYQIFAELNAALIKQVQSPDILQQNTQSLSEALLEDVPELAALNLTGSATAADGFAAYALAMRLVADPDVASLINERIDNPEEVRKQLKLKAFQGGDLLDFWSKPSGGTGADSDRGKLYPAWKLFGLGFDFPVLPRATIDAVLAAPGGKLFIEVGDAKSRYKTCPVILRTEELERALALGSIFQPLKPKLAYLNHRLFAGDAVYPNENDRNLDATDPTFKTGEGLVEFHIVPHRKELVTAKDDDRCFDPMTFRSEGGFNIYGIWEGAAGMERYFSDPDAMPSLGELRPFLITRRYSFERDLIGAFPNTGGQAHPGLKRALEAPASHPVLPRPKSSRDYDGFQKRAEGRQAPEIPDPFYRNEDGDTTIWAYDLRQGMKPSKPVPSGVERGWDPAGVINKDWSPLLDRDGNQTHGSPQGYRFFVTAVDAYDQESEPCAVHVGDSALETGENPDQTIYYPRVRSQVPQPDDIEVSASGQAGLKITWRTPPFSEEDNRKGWKALFDPASNIGVSTKVKIYRRRLLEPVLEDADNIKFLSAAEPDIHWRQFDANLALEGWEPVHSAEVSGPVNGAQLQYHHPLAYHDRGFEYRVGVNFSVPSSHQRYWLPLARERTIDTILRKDGQITAEERTLAEAPSSSDIAAPPPIAIVNADAPRGPVAGSLSGQLAAAKPVLPPPGVQRDLVLSKLVSLASPAITPPEAGGWLNTGVVLNQAQKAVAEAALHRSLGALSDVFGGDALKISDDRLAASRRIIAQTFNREADDPANAGEKGKTLGLHPTVGFRGFMHLAWRYEPHAARRPSGQDQDAETTSFEVHSIRIPEDNPQSAGPAISARASVRSNGFTLEPREPSANADVEEVLAEQDKAMREALLASNRPAFGLFVADHEVDGERSLSGGSVTAARLVGDKIEVDVDQSVEETPVFGTGDLHIFFPNRVTSTKVNDFAATSALDLSVTLPVSGGYDEIACWWIIPLSAQNLRGDRSRMQSHAARFASSLEPRPVERLDVYSALDRQRERLKKDQLGEWAPGDIADDSDAISNPRLVVRWRANERDLLAIIERNEKRMSDEPAKLLSVSEPSQWARLRTIEQLDRDAMLETDWIEKISTGESAWLHGHPVEPDGDPDTENQLVDVTRELSADDGLLKLESGNELLPAFIDYRQTLADSNVAMDSNWLYKYRMRLARVITTENGQTYPLLSQPSAWSEWTRPETPPIQVRRGADRTEYRSDIAGPEIHFELSASSTQKSTNRLGRSLMKAERQGVDIDPLSWKYKVVIRRRMRSLRPTEEGSAIIEELIDVGRPVILLPEQDGGESTTITDTAIEREFFGQVIDTSYEIYVQQFAIRTLPDGQRVETPVRSHTSEPQHRIPIQVKAPIDPDDEVIFHQKLTIQ